MSSNNPEPVIFPSKALYCSPFIGIPNPNSFILSNAQNQILTLMKQGCGSIVKVSATSIHFPGLRLRHAPYLNETIVTGGNDEWERRMEGNPVYAAVMAFKNVFYDGVGVAEQVGLGLGVGLQTTLEELFLEGYD
jgi:hypothetical protein